MEQMDFSIEVSESEIEKFADYLYQKENAKATINKYMADIKKFLSFLADDKRICCRPSSPAFRGSIRIAGLGNLIIYGLFVTCLELYYMSLFRNVNHPKG